MYQEYFQFTEWPFSIVPNSRFLYQSRRHSEAIFQIKAGLGDGGGFAMLTGEVGTGKTTVSKAILATLNSNIQAGVILNPTFSDIELLEAICDEFGVEYPSSSTLKILSDSLYEFLLTNHAQGIQTLVVIDEAQHLSVQVLEQLRLLTNLETESQKLLKVLLIGQPELQQKLQMPQLRQLAQRMTGRYHLLPLNPDETKEYIKFRLEYAGGKTTLFDAASLKHIAHRTFGIPRLINLVCDASLKHAYAMGEVSPSLATVEVACEEVMSFQTGTIPISSQSSVELDKKMGWAIPVVFASLLSLAAYYTTPNLIRPWIASYVQEQYPKTPLIQEVTEVPKELRSELSQYGSFESAMTSLYKVWGYKASMSDSLCIDNDDSKFFCQLSQGDIETLLNLNRPVVLSLLIDSEERFAVLYGLSDSRVKLLIGERVFSFDRQALNLIWHGDYHQIWHSRWDRTLQLGMKGKDVISLDQSLSKALGKPISDSKEFNQQLLNKVREFQGWQGLNVDGIAGQQTLRHLERLSQPDAPSLTIEVPDNV